MRVYNFYSTSLELRSYLRQPRKGKAIYSSTSSIQPFLQEYPIEVSVQFNEENSMLNLNATIYKKNSIQVLQANFIESEENVSEDLVEWENKDYKISLQAITNQEAYIVWENKKFLTKEIIFTGKIHPLDWKARFLQKWLK